ncbi:MAG: BON domain-containing protein [Myxococcales bacterium]|nr:BON domain-containing protein [Myxococcales bacterium]
MRRRRFALPGSSMFVVPFRGALLAALLTAAEVFAATPDGLLTSKTKLRLWTKAGVKSGAVHVDTVEGVVTISGMVPSALERVRLEKAVRTVGGVRDVTNRLRVVASAAPGPFTQSDQATHTAVERVLSADVPLRDSAILVKSVDQGVVLLGGTAHTLSDHLRAIMLADRVRGVERVASEVEGPEGFSRDELAAVPNRGGRDMRSSAQDLSTSTSVKLRLLTAAVVSATEINVDTNDGIVTLFGNVPTDAVRVSAGHEATKATGVVRVDNLLEVVPSNQKGAVDAKDADIARALMLATKDKAEFKHVTTSVKNGVVQLTGWVGSGWDEVSMARLARRTAGVRSVEDQLRVDELPN